MSDPANSLVLMKCILNNDELRAKWFTKDSRGHNTVNIVMAKKWLQETGLWCIKLCTLLHVTIGQPARGTEFASTNIRATAGGAGRGVM